ncbi:hypothetical protein EVAR_21143_1 [Eumeta japonica]|uniref:Uncharacterized protein n=1 Tax=Eumeta variegata TaxID=151549 RepID=A0A4C1VSQ1_EUMVA|nr:hypothetical protein EVAR_21143_1 [Eumeta japonica]
MDTRNPRGFSSMLPAFWVRIGYVMEGGLIEESEPPELKLTGRNTTAEVVISRLYSVRMWSVSNFRHVVFIGVTIIVMQREDGEKAVRKGEVESGVLCKRLLTGFK